MGDIPAATDHIKNDLGFKNRDKWPETKSLYCPLVISCCLGFEDIFDLLLNTGKFQITNENPSLSPLYAACKNGHFKIVEKILKISNSNINRVSKDFRTPLVVACENGYLDIVKLLLRNPEIDVMKGGFCDSTAFSTACSNGRVDIVNELLNDFKKRKISKAKKRKMFEDSFSISCMRKQKDVIDIVIKIDDFDPNPNKFYRKSNFEYFMDNHDYEMLEFLLKYEKLNITISDTMDINFIKKIVRLIAINPINILRIKKMTKMTFLDDMNLFSIFALDCVKFDSSNKSSIYSNIKYQDIMNNKEFKDLIMKIRINIGVADEFAKDLWIITRMMEHRYYSIRNCCSDQQKRFFIMILKLPYEMQMSIINKVYYLTKSFIKIK